MSFNFGLGVILVGFVLWLDLGLLRSQVRRKINLTGVIEIFSLTKKLKIFEIAVFLKEIFFCLIGISLKGRVGIDKSKLIWVDYWQNRQNLHKITCYESPDAKSVIVWSQGYCQSNWGNEIPFDENLDLWPFASCEDFNKV